MLTLSRARRYTISPLIVSACIYKYYKSLKVNEATSGQSSSSQVAGSTRFGFDFSKSFKKKMEYTERQPSSGSRPPLPRGETELFLFIQDDLEERESQVSERRTTNKNALSLG